MKFLFVFSLFSFSSCSYINRDRPDEGAEWSDALLDTVQLGTGIITCPFFCSQQRETLNFFQRRGSAKYHKQPCLGQNLPDSLPSRAPQRIEKHEVTTSDGYILTVHRIPRGRVCSRERVKGPIILQHGIFAASAYWILAGTKRGLAYILADSCYDVWMPNSRGNSNSLRHVKYTPRDPAFWDFSWHEMGLFDHPAVFDYVLNVTRSDNITYIGHSQGTTNFLVFNQYHPEYNDKMRAAFLLAPISYLGHSTSLFLQVLSRLTRPIQFAANLLGIYDIVQQKDFISNVTDVLCTSLRPVNPFLCENSIFLFTGFDNEQANLTFYTFLFKNEVYGSSIKQLVHFAQLVKSDNFQLFDYGNRNVDVYGQPTVPQYDLTMVKAPIHLYIAANDWLSELTDVFRLRSQLPNVIDHYLVPFEKFNHLDHLFAKDVVQLEYDHLLEQLDRYYDND